jgi:hypothetical protein
MVFGVTTTVLPKNGIRGRGHGFDTHLARAAGRLLHEIASIQCSLVYCDKGLITCHGYLKYGGGEFTIHLRVLV